MSFHRLRGAVGASVLVVASCGGRDPRPPQSAPRAAADASVAARVIDRDGDGVADDLDRCPDDPEDCDGFEDADGCPDDDNDHDGLPDRCDECADRPARTPTGCPRVELEWTVVIHTFGPTFAQNGVKPSFDVSSLDQVIAVAKQDRLKRIGLVGHALATERDGARLAMRRAEAVKAALVARGVSPTKLELRAAPIGDVDSCPSSRGSPEPCVSFVAVQLESHRMAWDGTRYVDLDPPKSAPIAKVPECPPPPPRAAGHPCRRP